MKKSGLVLLLSALLLLSACAPSQSGPSGEPENSATPAPQTLRVAATTYPVYLLTTAVTEGVEGVEVTLMLNQPTSCLHDYNLSSTDMKALEGADAVVLSGAGLEDFMSDALAGSDAAVIDSAPTSGGMKWVSVVAIRKLRIWIGLPGVLNVIPAKARITIPRS